ncbi:putative glycolipid-binding domain-containing protein [Actinosynnema sp. ALI-1.44]|uniref:putative glycolipid-binding domain-containing protein n=1 Tax=Actinosynnema sp. ALI-1.44 TaxID=1933779 RepID=UPI001EDAFA32|nr:putative glycolipid-binding domain-containing protein [Actinosynnema sp. ALI-1.44]
MTTTLTRKPTIMTWQGIDSARLESVRLLVADNRLRASGRLIAAATTDTEAYSASYEAATDQYGGFHRLLIRATTAEEERQISVNRTEDGTWLVDRGQGTERSACGGALEVDVAGSVLFNSLPIRRLGLHRESGRHELPVVYVSLPDLSVRVSQQTYTTVSVGDESSVITYTHEAFTTDMTVDSTGFVTECPPLVRRV